TQHRPRSPSGPRPFAGRLIAELTPRPRTPPGARPRSERALGRSEERQMNTKDQLQVIVQKAHDLAHQKHLSPTELIELDLLMQRARSLKARADREKSDD